MPLFKKRIFLPLYRSGGMILNAPINTRTSAWRRVFLHCKKKSWKLSVTNCCQWSFVVWFCWRTFFSLKLLLLPKSNKIDSWFTLFTSILENCFSKQSQEEEEKSWVNELLTILLYNLICSFEQVSRKYVMILRIIL